MGLWYVQSYEIKCPPWTILWFRILGIFSVENIRRLCVFMVQTWDNSQLLIKVLWISAELTIFSSLKHKNTQPLYILHRENPQNSEPQNGPRSGLDDIALAETAEWKKKSGKIPYEIFSSSFQEITSKSKYHHQWYRSKNIWHSTCCKILNIIGLFLLVVITNASKVCLFQIL